MQRRAELVCLAAGSLAAACFIWQARRRKAALTQYSAPLMDSEELKAISVPLENVECDLMSIMKEHGCALVTGVIGDQELLSLEKSFHSDLVSLIDEEAVTGAEMGAKLQKLKDGGVADFPPENVASLTSCGLGLNRCLAHCEMAWRIRMHKNVHRTFAALFPSEPGPLLTSLDVPFLSHALPEGYASPVSNKMSAHSDQNSNDAREQLRTCDYYQGVLYIWGAEADDATTTVVWPGSHKRVWQKLMSDENFQEWGQGGEHYCEIGDMKNRSLAAKLAFGWGKAARRVPAPKGKHASTAVVSVARAHSCRSSCARRFSLPLGL